MLVLIEMYVTDMIVSTSVSNVIRALCASSKGDKGGKDVIAVQIIILYLKCD